MHAPTTTGNHLLRVQLASTKLAVAIIAAILFSVPSLLRAQQTFYVSSGSQTIAQVSPAGVVSTLATLSTNSNPLGLAFDGGGNLYATSNSNAQINRIAPAGVVSASATLPTPAFTGPVGLTFDGVSNLYAATRINSRAAKISPSGTVNTFASVNPGYTLNGLAFDASGNLYTADGNSNQISRITPAGMVSLFAIVPASTAQYRRGHPPSLA